MIVIMNTVMYNFVIDNAAYIIVSSDHVLI
jgi:hypothetical protein